MVSEVYCLYAVSECSWFLITPASFHDCSISLLIWFILLLRSRSAGSTMELTTLATAVAGQGKETAAVGAALIIMWPTILALDVPVTHRIPQLQKFMYSCSHAPLMSIWKQNRPLMRLLSSIHVSPRASMFLVLV